MRYKCAKTDRWFDNLLLKKKKTKLKIIYNIYGHLCYSTVQKNIIYTELFLKIINCINDKFQNGTKITRAWTLHTQKLHKNTIEVIMNWKSVEKKPRGRPRSSWSDVIEKDLVFLTANDKRNIAQDQKKCNEYVILTA